MVSKLGGAWIGKTIRFPANSVDEAEKLREIAFNAARSVKPTAKIETTIVKTQDTYQLQVKRIKKNG